MAKSKKGKKKFYAVVTEKDHNIYTTWADCQRGMKGLKKVNMKGFENYKDAEKFILEHKETPTRKPQKTSSPSKEQPEKQLNESNDEISNVDLTETNTEKDTSENVQIKYCSHNCKYENGDESHDTMLTCDMCDRWYHLTCIDITEEMAKELSAWICKQCKDSFSLINTLKNDVLQSTDAIQDLKKELYTLKNNVSHLPCQKDMKEQSNGGHLSDPWKSKHNFETTPVPFDIKTPQGQTRSARHTESTPYYLKLEDSMQQRMSYLEGKIESFCDFFKFTQARQPYQSDNDPEKKKLQEENNYLKQRIIELEKVLLSTDMKARPNIIQRKDQTPVDDDITFVNTVSTHKDKNVYTGGKTTKLKVKQNGKEQTRSSNKNRGDHREGQKKVLIVGDSQLKRIDGNKLSSESRNVQVTAVGGMRIEQLKNHVEHDKWDNIVVHVGTNNLKEGNPTKITDKLDQCLTFIQARNPNCQVAFSGIFSRKDNPDLNRNGHIVNEKIKDRLMERGIDFIDNSNILFSNLFRDGLHLSSEGGVPKYCKNLSDYLRYSTYS